MSLGLSCPQGFKCSPVSGSGGDIVTVCVPAFPRLCEPCNVDSDCNNVLGGADNRRKGSNGDSHRWVLHWRELPGNFISNCWAP